MLSSSPFAPAGQGGDIGPIELEPAVRVSIDQAGRLSALLLQQAIDEVRAIWVPASQSHLEGTAIRRNQHNDGPERVLARVPARVWTIDSGAPTPARSRASS